MTLRKKAAPALTASAFVIGTPAPEGLDSKIYRVRVVVDRIDGGELTAEDLEQIEAVYPSKPSKALKPRAKAAAPSARKGKTTRRSGRAA
jgi:hypothetical protein